PIAPTGLMRSWQTREHSNAARSAAPSSTMLVMADLPFARFGGVGAARICRINVSALYSATRAGQRKAARSEGVAPNLLEICGARIGKRGPVGCSLAQRAGRRKVEGR